MIDLNSWPTWRKSVELAKEMLKVEHINSPVTWHENGKLWWYGEFPPKHNCRVGRQSRSYPMEDFLKDGCMEHFLPINKQQSHE